MKAGIHHWFGYWSSAIAFAALFASVAFAQQATVAVAGLTPKQLQDGTAKLTGHFDPTQTVRLVVGLQHPHLVDEEAFLKELGTKGSPNFQKFLTADEWNRRFSPSAADEQAVVHWAQSQGLTVSQRYANRLLVDIEGPAQKVETALGVTLNAYQVGNRTAFSNVQDPVIPATLKNIIHSIGGLNSVQVLRPSSKSLPEPQFSDYNAGPVKAVAGMGAGNAKTKPPFKTQALGPKPNISGGAYDPTDIYSSQAYDLQALYNQGHCCNPLGNPGVTPPESSIAIATAGSQSASDLAGFAAAYPYLAYHYQEYFIDGTPPCCDGEGTMDFDWATAWANSFGSYIDTAMIYLYDGVNANFSTFTDVYNQILSDGHAKVFSTSWGCEETACTPNSVMDTDHGIFNAMVGQGWTLVAASGDQGATAGCGNAVAVQYPASDPDIVGAGGTTLTLGSSGNYISETGWSGGPSGCGANDGGSTGGSSSYYAAPSYQTAIGLGGNRFVPDLALNADWYNTPQNMYFGGALSGNGGTSIVAPSIAGFFANTNAYLDFVATQNGGCYGTTTCAPIGNGNWYLYYLYQNVSYAPHYPFYDIVSGCSNNDITALYGLGYYCALSGYDEVTGIGSFNALQLARAITAYRAGDFVAPTATFTGPLVNHWYNTDQTVSWTVADQGSSGLPATGVGGFSQSWDAYLPDSTSEASPGSGDSFYSGPQFPNATSGYLLVSSAGQGCHTANVRSWDNSGFSGYQTYGPVCYDTIAPASTATLSGTAVSGTFESAVTVKLAASDAGSGVNGIRYKVDGGGYAAFSSPFIVSTLGAHSLTYYAYDVAGNTEAAHTKGFLIKSPTKTTVSASSSTSAYGVSVTFTATVSATSGSTPTGTVTFKDGATTLGTATLSTGKASYSTSTLHGGTHAITATYGAGGFDLTSTSSPLTHTVTAATSTTSVSHSLNPSSYGQAVVFTATIVSSHGGAVSGTVTFKNGSTTLGTGTVNSSSKATYTTSALSVGSHTITASYGGSSSDLASSGTITQTVNKAATTTTLVSALNPSTAGKTVTFTADIVGAHGGSISGAVVFKNGTTTLGSANLNSATGKASFSTSSLSKGSHSISAAYQGSANSNISSSSTLTQVVH
jgi:Pro-kumamolisin, activation domain/Bacterial Ig-like domain (group 3)